jgi:hypothetical protein
MQHRMANADSWRAGLATVEGFCCSDEVLEKRGGDFDSELFKGWPDGVHLYHRLAKILKT